MNDLSSASGGKAESRGGRPQEGADGYHWQLVRRAIEIIDAAEAPLSLAELAGEMHMSPAHFQRLFTRWVGVSPKRYQQYLMLGQARRLLAERRSTLDVAQSLGLSGTSRLHDLVLRWEAMSPGTLGQRGAGLTIGWGLFDSPFGEMLAMGTEKGLCALAFCAECGREAAMDDLRARWPAARFREDRQLLAPWIEAALGMRGEARLQLMGAPFHIKVWEALLAIPSGHVCTYSDIAAAIGRPRAVRAVGTAVGRNPVSWLIPCHRVLRRDGQLGGYHWGLPVKRALLARESAQAEAS